PGRGHDLPSGGQHRAWWPSRFQSGLNGYRPPNRARRRRDYSPSFCAPLRGRSGTLSHRYSVRRWSMARRASSRLAVLALLCAQCVSGGAFQLQHRDRSDAGSALRVVGEARVSARLLVVDAVALVALELAELRDDLVVP